MRYQLLILAVVVSLQSAQAGDWISPNWRPCPRIFCWPRPICPHPENTEFCWNGKWCRGCPRCPCQLNFCTLIYKICPAGQEFIPSASLRPDGKICPGCRDCFPKCPLLACPFVYCSKPRQTTYIYQGRECHGCPQCCPIYSN